jgi:inosine/guanosine/xanthosine phosphorylase family protein
VSAYEKAARQIRAMARSHSPEIGIILGSGLAGVATGLDDAVVIPYSEIEGFPEAGVEGHTGQLVIGKHGGRSVACLQGRWHAYEGHNLADIALPIRTLKALGCQSLLITCAAGSLQEDMPPGSLMMLTDHINWPGLSPLIGPNDDELGPRFTDLSNAYDSELQEIMRKSASNAAIHLHEGVYLWCLGPSFETPAEIRAFAALGADAVGMSTVPETLAARHCGLKVAAMAVITNFAAGMQSGLSHEQTLAAGAKAAPMLTTLIGEYLQRLPGTDP